MRRGDLADIVRGDWGRRPRRSVEDEHAGMRAAGWRDLSSSCRPVVADGFLPASARSRAASHRRARQVPCSMPTWTEESGPSRSRGACQSGMTRHPRARWVSPSTPMHVRAVPTVGNRPVAWSASWFYPAPLGQTSRRTVRWGCRGEVGDGDGFPYILTGLRIAKAISSPTGAAGGAGHSEPLHA